MGLHPRVSAVGVSAVGVSACGGQVRCNVAGDLRERSSRDSDFAQSPDSGGRGSEDPGRVREEMTKIGQEIIRICFANEDKPGKVTREFLKIPA